MRPNEIWVSDITYVETDEGVCYLSLITDAYSHKIVGWARSHYFSVTRKPIAGGLLLSRVRFLFGFRW